MSTILDFDIQGMTCASCVARIEKKLSKLPGVEASVNLATERAAVTVPDGLTADDIIHTVEAAGYGASLHQPDPIPAASAPDPAAALRDRLIICAVLTAPVLVLSMAPPLQFTYWQWLCFALASPVAVWGAWPFHRSMAVNLRHGSTTMDTLVSIGVIAAYLWSVYALFFGGAGVTGMRMPFEWLPSRGSGAMTIYLEVASVLTTLILLGRYFEARALRQSSAAIRNLLDLGAKDVTLVRDGNEVCVPIAQLGVGDQFVTRPGEKIATDGTIVSGHSAIDESLVTGESVPRDVGPGETVVGATLNAQGRLLIKATRVGQDTQLAQMGRLIEQAQTAKAPIQKLADRISAVFVPIVLVIAVLTLVGWLIVTHQTVEAFAAAVAVVVIACPCALGLATPAALMVGTGRGAQLGILIKGPQILESTRRIDTVVLDKTGTITTGQMSVVDIIATAAAKPVDVAAVAAAVENASEHPIARAIAAYHADHSGVMVSEFTAHQGLGVTAVVIAPAHLGGDTPTRVAVGRLSWLRQDHTIADETTAQADRAEASGRTVIAVMWDGQAQGLITVADTVKPSSAQAIDQFRALGVTPYLLTGDNPTVAAAIAGQVGIDHVEASLLPQDKVGVVKRLQAGGHVVAVVGDGVNDAAALATADLGIAMGAGADVAIEASDITLVRDDLMDAADAVRLSRATLSRIKGNLFWAFAYNVAAIPLAVLGLLNPMIAGAAMAFSSVFVVQNSLWLRRFRRSVPQTTRLAAGGAPR
ncbi:MAG: heavy metal translocating P-type ATPase [Propionibacteriaceae bacterium]|nr:heavy metal translocating P-type ATPase [Propionibacteriaceae bacterium]